MNHHLKPGVQRGDEDAPLKNLVHAPAQPTMAEIVAHVEAAPRARTVDANAPTYAELQAQNERLMKDAAIFDKNITLAHEQRDDALAEAAESQRQLALEQNITASLRRELAAEREDNLRWRRRTWALEARLEHITNIAAGHAVVEGAEEEGSAGG